MNSLESVALSLVSCGRPGSPTRFRKEHIARKAAFLTVLACLSSLFVFGSGISLRYMKPATESEQEVLMILKRSARLSRHVAAINRSVNLPYSVEVSIGHVDGPQYDLGTRRISIPYSTFVPFLYQGPPDDYVTRGLRLSDAFLLVFAHELGHALSDLLKLRLPGDEERSADALAVLVIAEFLGETKEAALGINALLDLKRSGYAIQKLSVESDWTEQRFDYIRCLLAGSDWKRLGWILGVEPAASEAKCRQEYQGLRDLWLQKLTVAEDVQSAPR